MEDVTPRENALFFLILNRSIYLSNWIRIAIFAFKFHESFFFINFRCFCFLSFFFSSGSETSSSSTPYFEISKNMKDLKHNISSLKDTSTASMIAVSLFEYIQGFNFLSITAFIFKLPTESYVQRGTHS